MLATRVTEANEEPRRGAIIVLAAAMMIMIFAFAAFAIDLSYMALTATELQNAADAAALSGITRLAESHGAVIEEVMTTGLKNRAAGKGAEITASDIEFGKFDLTTRTFTKGSTENAIRVTASVKKQALFFGPVLGQTDFEMSRSAVAMLTPRDIAFVVDLSGSMNDDTEPCWATSTINGEFADDGYPTIGNSLCQKFYDDLNFGAYPGSHELIGEPLGITDTWYAYALMTMDNGPLTLGTIAAKYRIKNTDSEDVRKTKAYSWIIDNQLATLMPKALPKPDSSKNYAYWEKYLDYVLAPIWVGYWEPWVPPEEPPPEEPPVEEPPSDPPPPPPPTPPSGAIDRLQPFQFAGRRSDFPRTLGQVADISTSLSIRALLTPTVFGEVTPGVPRLGSTDGVYLPPNQDWDRIYYFNNPNYGTFPAANGYLPWDWVNRVGYVTYAQYLLDWGRDRSPLYENDSNVATAGNTKTQLSVDSPNCSFHMEATAGGNFSFPPSEQPMHAVRRAMISAINEVKDKNAGLAAGVGDQVSLITFDAVDAFHAPVIRKALTSDYKGTMQAAAVMQAVSDIGNSTATEAGMALARQHLKPTTQGGAARTFTTKVIVLLTDGVPNVWASSDGAVSSYMTANPSGDYYDPAYVWYNAVLMQTAIAETEKTKVFGVGMGLGADLNFMDRIARIAGTDQGGFSPRGTGNPAEYEAQLTEIFKKIINTRGGKLVK